MPTAPRLYQSQCAALARFGLSLRCRRSLRSALLALACPWHRRRPVTVETVVAVSPARGRPSSEATSGRCSACALYEPFATLLHALCASTSVTSASHAVNLNSPRFAPLPAAPPRPRPRSEHLDHFASPADRLSWGLCTVLRCCHWHLLPRLRLVCAAACSSALLGELRFRIDTGSGSTFARYRTPIQQAIKVSTCSIVLSQVESIVSHMDADHGLHLGSAVDCPACRLRGAHG